MTDAPVDKDQLLSQLALAVSKKQAVTEAATTELYLTILAAADGGCSLSEIGAAMGIDRQTARWHITKAREASMPGRSNYRPKEQP